MKFHMNTFISLTIFAATIFSLPLYANEQFNKEIQQLKEEYNQRLITLENKQIESTSINNNANAFNPQLSFILDGQFTTYQNNPEDYELPGFVVGGEAGLKPEGFSLGHTEITASANIDDKFFGKSTLVIHQEEGETEVELEEAFIQTTAMPKGFSVKAGRFFSSIGYVNQQHPHAWDFADAPLVYSALWGNSYKDNGVQASWIAPTDIYFELGAEALSGAGFPAGGEVSSDVGSQVLFANVGGDFDESQSWKVGVSFHQADVVAREAGGHAHGEEVTEVPSFSGDSETIGLNFIYKWAPNGNYRDRNFKFQGEIFSRDEEGTVEMLGSNPLEQSEIKGEQGGYYLQTVYQFKPQWRVGGRYDHLNSDVSGNDDEVVEEAGLDNEGVTPTRKSVMLEWIPSEFSRLRLQFNVDDSYEAGDKQVMLQYTMSMGAHGAHTF